MLNFSFLIALGLSLISQNLFAHPPGLSSAELTLDSHQTELRLTFAIQDLEALIQMDSDQDAEVTPMEMEAAKPQIAAWVTEHFRLSADGTMLKANAAGTVNFDNQNNAQVNLHYSEVPRQQLRVDALFLTLLPAGHKQYLTLNNAQGQRLNETMLTQETPFLVHQLTEVQQNTNEFMKDSLFVSFLKLGIEHILTGYDHLLFLFSLLVVTHQFWSAFKIITCFTLSHSITLALASLNIVNLPGEIVEPLIALTIIYVALENLWRKQPKGREWLTAGFGLIHGFGFASVLREMDINSSDGGILLPLFSFNLGVELGQILVAALILPLIWWMHRQNGLARHLTPIGSTLTGLAGCYWLIERTMLG